MKSLLDLYRQYDVEIALTEATWKKDSTVGSAKKPGSGKRSHGTSGKKGGDIP